MTTGGTTGTASGAPEEGTGRIRSPLSRKAQRLYYGEPDDDADRAALTLIARVDRAHVVMLAEQGTIPRAAAARLLATVDTVEADGFTGVLGQLRPRGLYLAYEQLVTRLSGPAVGGLLHTARSRNDLLATTTLLGLRHHLLTVLEEGCRLLTVLLSAAGRHLDVTMPVHTHFQPAMPVTYGYYLTGIALALHRDLDRLLGVLDPIATCPLGAHAVAGTDLRIDADRTAHLLGFASGPVHAVDAVASRDACLAALSATAAVGVTVSRLATDLQFWSSADLAYVSFPDWLTGSSSAMPQKRNAFLLEYLKARPARITGALVTTLTAVSCTPFTNSIEVGTEGMAGVGPALATAAELLAVAALVVSGAEPSAAVTRAAADRGLVDATAYAGQLVRSGIPFREAHARIGAAVLDAVEGTGAWPPPGLPPIGLDRAVDEARYGGGPGRRAEALAVAWERRHRLRTYVRERVVADVAAGDRLRAAVVAVAGG